MHIILVDDHELFATSLAISLKNSVEKFEVFTTPEKMIIALKENIPDVLLLDIHIGESNGLDIAEEVLTLYPDIKVVFLSGYDLLEYHNQAIKIGAKGFITKNTSISDLIEKLTSVKNGAIIFPEYEFETEPLTDREKEILQLVATGLPQKEIADKLSISRRTVNNHIQTIHNKFHVNSTVAAIVRGIELGIVAVNNR